MLRSLPGKRLIPITDRRETRVVDVVTDCYDSHVLYEKTAFITPLRFGPMHTRWVLPQNIAAAVFATAEQRFGRNIYGQMVREDLSFLR